MDRANYGVRDASLASTLVDLPNGAATIYSGDLDLGLYSTRGARMEECELVIEAPLLVVGDLGNGDTMKYSVMHGAAAAPTTVLAADVIVQTGAGGVGAAAQTVRFRFPTTTLQYVRVRAINSGAGDASDKHLTVWVAF